MSENDELGDDWAAALNEQSEAEAEADWGDALKEQAASGAGGYTAAEFPELDGKAGPKDGARGDEVKLDVILDVPVTVSLEIGRTKINIRNLLQLNQGSVVELDRFAGEPMDVLVNGTLVAHGEVVVVNDKFGIRLTDIISPSERVRKLG
ncbi:flagellar motor switch protein FliN [Methylomonas sp. MED-D]|uniref:Flagellar motor switch protein FliN n=1 Tax=Methylomonas koyamae TaxID=702114 RepID=A0A177P7V8_9GAMM|nr:MULTISPECIES: flagellar motor switch protein FliN [Methylomonas]NJA08430.1 flagellar motor switch protein FliN [Methylococcaceae bacterium WWC4]MDT4330291.1 flagellar motor switch protein FliN [Methylomonas sp. MV1]OAI25519.1 flagellar motor switch protein FliN [Methylomonas koyamae]OHX38320.1 flagellar motor switch protein FliN [Methylomonas sp. LWB]WGS86569.1 flagellar motor switch protein FliN [Methylomonas sp. UP202]